MFELNDKLEERAILVGVARPYTDRWEVEDHLDELAFLADTAGATVVEKVMQERKQIDPTYFVGRGKVEALAEMVDEHSADMVIFDDDLSPAQARNVEKILKKKIIDRSGLILDIFARRAKTREARTQVELAQLRYLLPRLTRQWTHLSRQVGGIGTRGPGETQLEVDRRLIRKRIGVLEAELIKIEKQRNLRRKHRGDQFKAALVGYTNVGKSTLINALTEADVFVEDRLFATLDATVRALRMKDSEPVLLIDTVGFIRKLPHHLVASFKSTLEEARDADLLLHVIDISHPHFEEQISTVNKVIAEMELQDKEVMYVFNKIDRIDNQGMVQAMREKFQPALFVSAARGLFLKALQEALFEKAHAKEENLQLVLDAGDGAAVARVHELAEVLSKHYEDGRVVLQARTTIEKAQKLKAFLHSRESHVALQTS